MRTQVRTSYYQFSFTSEENYGDIPFIGDGNDVYGASEAGFSMSAGGFDPNIEVDEYSLIVDVDLEDNPPQGKSERIFDQVLVSPVGKYELASPEDTGGGEIFELGQRIKVTLYKLAKTHYHIMWEPS